jgi:hypothetical protein
MDGSADKVYRRDDRGIVGVESLGLKGYPQQCWTCGLSLRFPLWWRRFAVVDHLPLRRGQSPGSPGPLTRRVRW